MQKYTASVITAGCLWGLMGLFTRTLATYGVDSTAHSSFLLQRTTFP